MLIDVHCHANLYLNFEEILAEAKEKDVQKIISVGMSATSLERILEITEKLDGVYPALGIHPEEVQMNKDIGKQLVNIIELIKIHKEKICAIGEIGLDHYFVKDQLLYPIQKEIFKKMLLLAEELNLPVILHTKGAEKEVFEMLSSYKIPNINVHWYSGPENLLKVGIERGYYFSITPAITYSPAVKKTALLADLDHLLLESDGPVEYSGKIGTPAMIKEVLINIAKLRDIDSNELENRLLENTKRIFPKIFENRI